MGILQSLKNALGRLIGKPGPQEPANLKKAEADQKAFNDETAWLDKATEAVEREKKLPVERKANLAETADVAARKKLKKVDGLIDKAAKLSAKKAATRTVKSAPKPAKPAVKPVKTKPKVQKKT